VPLPDLASPGGRRFLLLPPRMVTFMLIIMRAAGWLGENVEKPYQNDYHIPLRLNWHYNNRYRQRNSIDHVAEAACRTSCRILLNSEFLALHASCSISTMYRFAGDNRWQLWPCWRSANAPSPAMN